MFSKKNFFNFLSILSLVLITSILAFGQITTGNLQGVVRDPQGAVVPGATVKVTNTETGISKDTTTNSEGFYRVTNLNPGNAYTVEVTATGFSITAVQNVPVRLATENTADVQVNIQQATGEVTVTSGQELIQTTQSQNSTSFSQRQITQLPLNGGSIENLALLAPGVAQTGDATFTNGVGITANGNRGRSNNFQIDGQDNNDNSVAGPALTITNTEAIGEFQVITNTFSAEFGRNSGAQVIANTKYGTNAFHGSLFEYLQNSALNASTNSDKRKQGAYNFLNTNGFSNFAGLANRKKDPFTANRLGFALGGPIKKDKAFFFFTYQADRTRGEASANSLTSGSLTIAPQSGMLLQSLFPGPATATLTSTTIGGSPSFLTGFGQFFVAPPVADTKGTGVPDTFVYGPNNPFGNTPTANRLSNGLYVLNNGVATPIYFGEGVSIFRTDSGEDQIDTREDFNITNKDNVVFRFIYDNARNPNIAYGPTNGQFYNVPSQNYNPAVTYTRNISSRMVNEARFNFSRLNVDFGNPATAPPPSIGFSSYATQNFDFASGFGTLNGFPQSRKVDTYQIQDTVSTTLGNHAVKVGADIRFQRTNNFFLPSQQGVYTFRGGNPLAGPGSTNGAIPAGTPFIFNPAYTGGAIVNRAGFGATAYENFILGRPYQVTFALGNPNIRTKENDYFFFAQDDWRVRENLTLNLGVRYEVETTPFNPLIDALNARESNPSTALFSTAFPLSSRTLKKLPIDYNNIGPRLGFAYSPNLKFLGSRFSGGRTVLRGSFGIAYDPSFFNIVLNTVTAAPFVAVGVIRQTPGAAGSVSYPFLPNSTAQLASTPGTNGGNPRFFSQTLVDPNFHNPYTISYGGGIQQEIFKNNVVEVRYVGQHFVGQFQTINPNPNVLYLNRAAAYLGLDPGTFSNGLVSGSAATNFSNNPGTNGNGRIDPTQGIVRTRTNGARGNYNGLQIRYDSRLSNEFSINANYTFSKTIDNASEIYSTSGGGQGVSLAQRFFDTVSGERGLSAFDQRHNFSASFVLVPPFISDIKQNSFVGKLLGGFELSGTIRIGSGQPYTPLEAYGTYGPNEGSVLRPFNGNSSASNGTLAIGYGTLCNIFLNCTPNQFQGGVAPVPGNFVIYNTLKPGSLGVVVPNAQAAVQQARLIYNDFGINNQFGVPLSALEAFNYFKTPYGNVGRNTFTGRPYYLTNLSLVKTTNINEKYKIEFRFEASNIFNKRNFGVPDVFTEDAFNSSGVVSSFQNPGFNNGGSRNLRFGLRFLF